MRTSGAEAHSGLHKTADRRDRLRARVEAFFRRRGARPTEQRRIVIDAFLSARDHVTVDALRDQLRAVGTSIGYSTIYRTMRLLVENGFAVERRFADDITRFELSDDAEHHDHLICVECGSITEFEDPRIEALQQEVADGLGYILTTHKHELYGTCATCRTRSRGQG